MQNPLRYGVILLLSWLSLNAYAQAFDHSHSQFNELLQTHVNKAGFVDYKSLQNNASQLKSYLQELGAVDASQLAAWSEQQQLAYWINAYNAFTLKAIIDNYPIKRGSAVGLFSPKNSILQIPGVWKELEWTVATGKITLDNIEHEVLRKQYAEPRIHFAIVCASFSCPNLRNEAYIATQLDSQLNDQQQVFFINNEKGVSIDIERKRVKVSKIFDWFAEDFVVEGNDETLFSKRKNKQAGVLRYIVARMPETDRKAFLLLDDFRFDYLDYDWELNEQ